MHSDPYVCYKLREDSGEQCCVKKAIVSGCQKIIGVNWIEQAKGATQTCFVCAGCVRDMAILFYDKYCTVFWQCREAVSMVIAMLYRGWQELLTSQVFFARAYMFVSVWGCARMIYKTRIN